jgi:LacI family transcriptional regulator
MRKSATATLKDVAEQAEVSIMTASVVLSGKKTNVKVSDQTRQRVEEAARRLEYRPNALARSLRNNRTDTFGFYSGYPYMNVDNSFIHAIISGLMDGCNRNKKELLVYGDHRGQSVESIYARLSDRRVDGLVIWSPPDDPLIARLASSTLPVVSVESVAPSLPSVVVDDVMGTRLLLEHLQARGHRRLMHLTVGHQSTSRLRRHHTALEYAATLGLEMTAHVEEDWLEEWEDGRWINYFDVLLEEWKRTSPDTRPTAMFCWCDYMAYALLRKCLKHGLRVPEDLAIVGFDGFSPPRGFDGVLTTIHAPWNDIAQMAVRLLEARLTGQEVPEETMLPVELVVGKTT